MIVNAKRSGAGNIVHGYERSGTDLKRAGIDGRIAVVTGRACYL